MISPSSSQISMAESRQEATVERVGLCNDFCSAIAHGGVANQADGGAMRSGAIRSGGLAQYRQRSSAEMRPS